MTLMEAARKILPGLKWKNQRPDHTRYEGITANFPIPGGKQISVYRFGSNPPWNFTPNQIHSNVPLPPGITDEMEALRLVRLDLEAKAKMLRDALDTIADGTDKARIERFWPEQGYIVIDRTHFLLTKGRTHVWCTHGDWEGRLCYDNNGKLTHLMITDPTYGYKNDTECPMDDPCRRRDIGEYTLTQYPSYHEFLNQ